MLVSIKRDLLINVEIKEKTHETFDLTIEALRRFGVLDRCVITCFDAEIVKYVATAYQLRCQGFPGEKMQNFEEGEKGTYSYDNVARTSPFLFTIVLRAMMKVGHNKRAVEMIRGRFGKLLEQGATSTWEDWEIFQVNNSGRLRIRSASHAWGAGPILFFFEGMLGIRPLEPGFRSFTLESNLCGLERLEGKVPTPFGVIDIILEKEKEQIRVHLTVPEGSKAVCRNIEKNAGRHIFLLPLRID